MTGEAWTILAMGAGVFALRLAGPSFPTRARSTGCARGLAYLPVAVLSALATISLAGSSGGSARWLVAAVAAAVAWRTRRVWACLAAGMTVWWATAWVR